MVFRIVYYCCNHFRLSRFHPKTFDNIDHRRMCYLGNLSFDAIDISAFEKNSDGDIRTFRVEGEMAWTADRDRARLWNEDNLFRIRIDREDHRLRQRRNSDWTVWLKNKLNEILSIRWLDDITKQTFININSGENFLLGLILFCLVIDKKIRSLWIEWAAQPMSGVKYFHKIYLVFEITEVEFFIDQRCLLGRSNGNDLIRVQVCQVFCPRKHREDRLLEPGNLAAASTQHNLKHEECVIANKRWGLRTSSIEKGKYTQCQFRPA